MEKKHRDRQTEQLRDAMEQRAALIYFMVKAARDSGADYLAIGREAMRNTGRYKAERSFPETDRMEEFAGAYMHEDTLRAFDGAITELSDARLREESTYCPLVAAWRRLTDDEDFIRQLCDIAMCGDRGILSRYPQFSFALVSTLLDPSGTCCIEVTRKGQRNHE